MKLSKLIKQLNKENAPPDGWKPEDKVQAPSTKLKASSSKRHETDTIEKYNKNRKE